MAAIAEYGGWVRYDHQFVDGKFDPTQESWVPESWRDNLGEDFFSTVTEVNLVYSEDEGSRKDNSNIGPAPLEKIGRLSSLTRLYLQDRQATDDGLVHVGRLTQLKTFFAWNAIEVTDQGVAHLANLKKLEDVLLTKSKITDESLKVFGAMPKLKYLTLQFSRLSDEGILHLKNLTELESLWVCGVGDEPQPLKGLALKPNQNSAASETSELPVAQPRLISDESFDVFESFKKLTSLGIQNTNITADRLQAFQKANPSCRCSR